jgi:hypothetical protein
MRSLPPRKKRRAKADKAGKGGQSRTKFRFLRDFCAIFALSVRLCCAPAIFQSGHGRLTRRIRRIGPMRRRFNPRSTIQMPHLASCIPYLASASLSSIPLHALFSITEGRTKSVQYPAQKAATVLRVLLILAQFRRLFQLREERHVYSNRRPLSLRAPEERHKRRPGLCRATQMQPPACRSGVTWPLATSPAKDVALPTELLGESSLSRKWQIIQFRSPKQFCLLESCHLRPAE